MQAVAADAFADSICATVRMSIYSDKLPLLTQRFAESGIRYAMDSYLFKPELLRQLTAVGVRYGIGIGPGVQDPVAFAKAQGDGLIEIGLAPSSPPKPPAPTDAWAAEARAYLQRSYAALKGDPATRHLTVIGPSIGLDQHVTSLGDISAWVDVGGLSLFNHTPPGDPSLDAWIARSRTTYADKPLIFSQAGYSTRDMSVEVQTRYVARMLFEHFRRGIRKSCIDYFWDNAIDDGYGLVAFDGTPRPAFHAVQNLLQLTGDPGPADFRPGMLAFTLSGQTENVQQMLLQRRNGVFLLALWLAVPSTDAELTQKVKLTFPLPVSAVVIRRPQMATAALDRRANVAEFEVDVPDQVLLLEIVTGC